MAMASPLPLTAAPPTAAVLGAWLRTLWNLAPRVWPLAADDAPFIAEDGLHLPLGHADERHTMAAAAHAGAHTVYSRPGANTVGLGATTRVLAGLLEDARVEWLAGRELPGLRRLWAAQHTVEPGDGDDAETLMRRLTRALADERYADPHPWVAKGRRLFFLDGAQQVLALRQFEGARQAASMLGNDLGQMRLPLNARTYRPWPAYRDDNRWLWAPATPPEALGTGPDRDPGDTPPQGGPAPPLGGTTHRYPEWDQRIGRLRHDWVTVTETVPLVHRARTLPPGLQTDDGTRQRLNRAARAHRLGAPRWLRRQPEGETLDIDALLRSWLSRWTGEAFDPRVYRQRVRQTGAACVLLMLDTSASSADRLAGSGHTVLALTQVAARLCAEALQQAGHRCAIHGFSSEGRTRVSVQRVKDFDTPWDAACTERLCALDSAASTRLGAAIRHGTAGLLRHAGPPRQRHLAVLTDGQAHDIDVHEAGYLDEDARHAVQEAQHQGVTVSCFSLQAHDIGAVTRTFGAGRHHRVRSPADLPAALARLWR